LTRLSFAKISAVPGSSQRTRGVRGARSGVSHVTGAGNDNPLIETEYARALTSGTNAAA
jgi:hypothetical protein